jgi:hypothetical protein
VAVTATLSIAHVSRGRLRVRIPRDADVTGVEDAVAALPGVRSVTWQPRTRGLLVLYEPGAVESSTILDAVAEHADLDLPDVPAPADHEPPLTALLARPVADLNQRLHRLSGGLADLRSLAPAVLVAWAALQLLRGRGAPLAWSSALWYAHGLFRDYSVKAPE